MYCPGFVNATLAFVSVCAPVDDTTVGGFANVMRARSCGSAALGAKRVVMSVLLMRSEGEVRATGEERTPLNPQLASYEDPTRTVAEQVEVPAEGRVVYLLR